MLTTRTLPLSLMLAAVATAQTETSPKGWLATEAPSSHGSAFGYWDNHTFLVQVDGTLAGTGSRSIKKLFLRRDGNLPANAEYVARTIPVEVRFAHGDWSKVTSANYGPIAPVLKSAWTTGFTLKNVNLPSLSAAPAGSPAPWSIMLTLDTPFTFNGSDALVIGLRTDPSAASESKAWPIDFLQQIARSEGATTKLGTGCQVAGQAGPMFHSHMLWNYGFDGSYGQTQLTTGQAKPAVPVVVLIGTSNPNLAFGGCERLFTSGEVALSAGPTSAAGYCNLSFTFPQQPSFAGVQLYTQTAILDASQPAVGVALSHGLRTVYPAPPVGITHCALAQVGSAGTAWPTAMTFYKGSGLIFGLGSL